MKQKLLLSSFALTLLLFSCTGSLNTFSEYNKDVDLNKYQSYAWLAPGDNADSPQNQQMSLTYSKAIMYPSNDILKKKGMMLDTINPDAVFKFSIGMDQKMAYSQSPTLSVGVAVGSPYYYGGPGYYGGVAVPISGGNVTEHRADEAFLYIQMFDTKTGALLWTGGARKTIDNSADSQKNIKLALQSVFSNLKIKHKTK
jgi:hypothetical protein